MATARSPGNGPPTFTNVPVVLAGGNRINQEADPGLEDAAWYALEQDFGLSAGADLLKGVLLERGCKFPVFLAVVDENHGWTQGRRDHIHARSQRKLRDEAAGGCTNSGLVQVELRVGKFVAQTHDGGMFAIDYRAIGLLGTILCGDSPGHGLFCRVEVARCGVERRLRDDVLLEQRRLTVVVFLGKLQLRLGLFGRRRCLIDGRLELGNVGLGISQSRLLFRDSVLIWLGIDLEQNFAGLEMLVGTVFDRHLDHTAADAGQYRRYREVNARIVENGWL
jgi:hypothetical protein